MTATEWAAWVQALGSIAAIGAGFLFFHHQQKHASDARARALWGVLIMVNSFVAGVLSDTATVKTNTGWGDIVRHALPRLRSIRGLLDRVDLSVFGRTELWMAATNFWGQFDEVAAALEGEVTFADTHQGNSSVPVERVVKLERLLTALQSTSDHLSATLFPDPKRPSRGR